MAIIRCSLCRSEVHNTLDLCPHCGTKVPPPRFGFLDKSEVDWQECRERVDDWMRATLKCMDSPTPGAQAEAKFWLDRIEEMRVSLPEQEEAIFVNMMMQGLKDIQQRPGHEKIRLGIAQTSQSPTALPPVRSSGLAELAVRTAVRATVWESVRSLYRIFR